MREIKFRVWDIEVGRMSTVFHHTDPAVQWNDGDIDMPAPFANNPKRFIWLQYTGLKDKNGVEIYEGDIVQVGKHAKSVDVLFENGCFWLRRHDDNHWLYNRALASCCSEFHNIVEIIGNIHETKTPPVKENDENNVSKM